MTEAKTVAVELKDTVSADWQAKPKDTAPKGAAIVGGVMHKGTRSDNGKPGYQAIVNGRSTEVKAGFKPALVAALALENVVSDHYDFAEKWSDIYSTNKPKEPETLDELDKADKAMFEKGYKAIKSAQEAETKADANRLEKACKLADAVFETRDGMTSTQWALFRKLAPDTAVKEFLGKNTVGEAYKASALRRVEGFDLASHVGARVSGNKGIVSAYQSAVNLIAGAIVGGMHSAKVREELDIVETGDSESVRVLLGHFCDEGGFGVSDNGTMLDIEDDATGRLACLIAPLHDANIPAEVGLFEFSDGKYTVAKIEKRAVAGTLFGLEGDDELLAAIARKLSEGITKAATAEIADAGAAMVKEARESKLPFAKWPADRAARHLANILFSRWPEDGSDEDKNAAIADINDVLGRIGGFADELFAGNLTVADVLDPKAAPESAESAEEDADADMSE